MQPVRITLQDSIKNLIKHEDMIFLKAPLRGENLNPYHKENIQPGTSPEQSPLTVRGSISLKSKIVQSAENRIAKYYGFSGCPFHH